MGKLDVFANSTRKMATKIALSDEFYLIKGRGKVATPIFFRK